MFTARPAKKRRPAFRAPFPGTAASPGGVRFLFKLDAEYRVGAEGVRETAAGQWVEQTAVDARTQTRVAEHRARERAALRGEHHRRSHRRVTSRAAVRRLDYFIFAILLLAYSLGEMPTCFLNILEK